MSTPAWYPIAASDDLVAGHVFQAQLLGRELAVWRADDGFVNVWENRCRHRGVRLTLGSNEGGELVCRYHGWRYANRTGGCTYIPAQPGEAPPRSACATTYAAIERAGLVWTALGGDDGGEVGVADLVADRVGGDAGVGVDVGGDPIVLRALPVDAPAATVADALAARRVGQPEAGVTWFVQPVDTDRCIVRGLARAMPGDDGQAASIAVLRRHHAQFVALRDEVEAATMARRRPAPWLDVPQQRTAAVAAPHSASAADGSRAAGGSPTAAADAQPGDGRTPIAVRVASRERVADGVVAFTLQPVGAGLPTMLPGSHVDVRLPNGLVRQYSLVNAPGEQTGYVIGVKREHASRGGSAYLHDHVAVGDLLAVSAPRHQFVLRRDSFRTLLIAGGIGITPLLAMAQALHANGLAFELHLFAQSADHVAFPERMATLGDAVTLHLGLDPAATLATGRRLLAARGEGEQVYLCGPAPMLRGLQQAARDEGWQEPAVHVEYFANPTQPDTDTGFDVTLARSGRTVPVAPGETLLEVLRAAGADVASSCEIGTCGTCKVTVLDGAIHHQDVYLRADERVRGGVLLACVSRAAGERLVVDL